MVDRASDHVDVDIDQAREHIDWRPSHDVVSTIPEMTHHLRADRSDRYASNGLPAPRQLLSG